MSEPEVKAKTQYGMVIDLDRCNGCGSCMIACAVENNVPPATERSTPRTAVAWLQVHRLERPGEARAAYLPLACQQCGPHPPCQQVCPQNAVERDPATGIVAQIPVRCLGCRYCMTACPYHARSFNWFDPEWPGELADTLSPDVSTRTRGVVEKCTFCSQRLQAARAKQAAAGSDAKEMPDYTPACVEACPARALTFGNLNDPASAVARAAAAPDAFRLLERLGTGPKVYYRTRRAWVRQLALGSAASQEEKRHG